MNVQYYAMNEYEINLSLYNINFIFFSICEFNSEIQLEEITQLQWNYA